MEGKREKDGEEYGYYVTFREKTNKVRQGRVTYQLSKRHTIIIIKEFSNVSATQSIQPTDRPTSSIIHREKKAPVDLTLVFLSISWGICS